MHSSAVQVAWRSWEMARYQSKLHFWISLEHLIFKTYTRIEQPAVCLQVLFLFQSHTKHTISPCSFLSVRHLLCDEWGSDRVFYQNWQRNHLTELDSSGVCGSAERRVHGKAPGAPSYLLQQLTLRGRSCVQGRWQTCCWINITFENSYF